jgi:hypothetical protein
MEMDATVTIARPADAVFAYVSDVSNDVHWRTGVTESGLSTDPPLGLLKADAATPDHRVRNKGKRTLPGGSGQIESATTGRNRSRVMISEGKRIFWADTWKSVRVGV